MQRLDPQRTLLLTHLVSPHYPNQQILHLSDGGTDIHETLHRFTREKGFEYDLRAVGCETDRFESLREEAHEGYTLEPLDLQKRQYNKHARKYDNIFVTLDPSLLEGQLQPVLKKFYRIMKNGAILALVVPRGTALLQNIDEEIEACYFTATNHIDIFDDYDVVTTKKLHGWGAYDVGF